MAIGFFGAKLGKQAQQAAVDAIMNAPHPELDRRQCWNLHPHRKACTACKDICPFADDIFTRPNLVKSWDPCSNCGLCVSACPSRCISPSPDQIQRDAGEADQTDDALWIGCEKSTRKNTVVRECIAALSWETMAYLALNKRIVLDLTPCGECENDVCAALLRQNLTRLVEFFGQPLFDARFTLAYEPDEALYQPKELSRREAFSKVTLGSRQNTRQLMHMIPSLRSEMDNASLDFKLLLHQRTKQLKTVYDPPLHYGVQMPNITDKCFGCDKCEKSCRAGALRLEDQPDGQTRIVLTPWKCSECGLCVNACTVHAIDGMKLHQVTTLGPVILRRVQRVYCKDCGKPVPHDSQDGLCATCRIKRRTKQRQEEAAERARKRKAEREAAEAAKAAEAAAAQEGAVAAEEAAAGAAVAAAVETAVPTAETAVAVESAVPTAEPAATTGASAPEAAPETAVPAAEASPTPEATTTEAAPQPESKPNEE